MVPKKPARAGVSGFHTRTRTTSFLAIAGGLLAMLAPRPAAAIELGAPLDCRRANSCFIQNYVDVDAGPAARDYLCRQASYDGHKGTDFALRSLRQMAKGVPVLAAAPGTVKAMRDEAPDRIIATAKERQAVKGRECGNGVVIDHGGGWETQYCHMRRGSVTVAKGDRVARGGQIGLVGSSGDSQFPHVELTVRYLGNIIDPFTGMEPKPGCSVGQPTPLWTDAVRRVYPYSGAHLIAAGFAARTLKKDELMRDGGIVPPKDTAAPALVLYGWFANARKGDIIQFEIIYPGGRTVRHRSKPLDRNKARILYFYGKKRPDGSWPEGRYTGILQLTRNGNPVRSKTVSVLLKARL